MKTCLTLLALLCTSCTFTDVVSFNKPGVTPITAKAVVVFVVTPNLVTRVDVEDFVAQKIRESGTQATAMYSVVNPSLKLSTDSSISLASEKHDAALIIGYTGNVRLQPYSEGDARVEEDFEFDWLYLPSKQLVWVGSTSTSRDYEASAVRSATKHIIAKLQADGFLEYKFP